MIYDGEIEWVPLGAETLAAQMIEQKKFGAKIFRLVYYGGVSEKTKRVFLTWLIEEELIKLYIGKKKRKDAYSELIYSKCIDDFLKISCLFRKTPWQMPAEFPLGRTRIGNPIILRLNGNFIRSMKYDEVFRHLFLYFVFFLMLVYNQSMNSVITKKRILVIVFLVVCFLIINAVSKDGLKNFIYSKSASLQASLWDRGSEEAFSRQDQEKLNKELIEENQKLLSDLASLQGVREENESLREALGLNLQNDYDLVLGRVISKDILNDTILINIGSNDGIKKDFPVILSGKALLGRVIDVYPNYSRVMLITQKNNMIDVEIPDSKSFALSKGEGGLKASLDMFPRDIELKEDSLIITSAMGGNYPAGLYVGKVKNVKKLDNEVYQVAEIEKSFDLNTVNNVFVIKIAEIYND